jgi:hypothetical protein
VDFGCFFANVGGEEGFGVTKAINLNCVVSDSACQNVAYGTQNREGVFAKQKYGAA